MYCSRFLGMWKKKLRTFWEQNGGSLFSVLLFHECFVSVTFFRGWTLCQTWFFQYHTTCHWCNTKALICLCLHACINYICSPQQWKWKEGLSSTEKHFSLQTPVTQSKMWRWHIYTNPLSSCHFVLVVAHTLQVMWIKFSSKLQHRTSLYVKRLIYIQLNQLFIRKLSSVRRLWLLDFQASYFQQRATVHFS